MFRGQVNRAPHPWCHSPTKFMSWAKSNWAIKKSPHSSEAHGVYIIVNQPTSDGFARRQRRRRRGRQRRRRSGSALILYCTSLQLCRRHRCEFVWIYVYFVVTGWIILVVVCQRGVRLLDLWVNADFSFRMPYLIVDLCIVCCSWSKFLYFLNCLGVDQVWICKELLIFSCRNNFGDIVSRKVQSDVPSIYSKVVDGSWISLSITSTNILTFWILF